MKLFGPNSLNQIVLRATFALKKAGTAMASRYYHSARPGTISTLYIRIDTGPNSNNSAGVGPLTVITNHKARSTVAPHSYIERP